MRIKDYSEKGIRNKIISKVKPTVQKHRKHDKALIYVDGKMVARVKIPNSHKRIMKHSKSQFIASGLRLSVDEFNDLVDCHLKETGYYQKLKERI